MENYLVFFFLDIHVQACGLIFTSITEGFQTRPRLEKPVGYDLTWRYNGCRTNKC